MTVVMHLGPHKTGSTTIQARLAANRAALTPWSVVLREDRAQIDALEWGAIEIHRALNQGRNPARGRAVVARAAAAMPQGPLLISDELLAGDMIGIGRTWRVAPHLGALGRAYLDGFAPRPVRFVLYTRGAGWLASIWNQSVRTDRQRLDWPAFAARAGAVDLAPAVAALRAEGADVHVVSMEADAADPDGLGAALLRPMGVDPATVPPAPAQNTAAPKALAHALCRLNALPLSDADLAAVRDTLLANPEWFRAD